jgi:hypothetical protein
LGANALAKAHDEGNGLGFSSVLFAYDRFRAGFAIEHVSFEITDPAIVADAKWSMTTVFATLSYDFPVSKRLTIAPDMGYGTAQPVIGRKNKNRIGRKTG